MNRRGFFQGIIAVGISALNPVPLDYQVFGEAESLYCGVDLEYIEFMEYLIRTTAEIHRIKPEEIGFAYAGKIFDPCQK